MFHLDGFKPQKLKYSMPAILNRGFDIFREFSLVSALRTCNAWLPKIHSERHYYESKLNFYFQRHVTEFLVHKAPSQRAVLTAF